MFKGEHASCFVNQRCRRYGVAEQNRQQNFGSGLGDVAAKGQLRLDFRMQELQPRRKVMIPAALASSP